MISLAQSIMQNGPIVGEEVVPQSRDLTADQVKEAAIAFGIVYTTKKTTRNLLVRIAGNLKSRKG